MFKSNSRSNSRRQSIESINNLDDKGDSTEMDDQSINIIMDDRDKNLIIKDKDEFIQGFNDVNSNALGKILIDMATKTNKVLSKSTSEDLISIPTLIQAFKENLAMEQKKLSTESDNIRNTIINNRLNYHKIAPTVKAPAYFSPVDILISPAKSADVMRLFPKGRDKFSGKRNEGPEINEFLHTINLAQAKCKLSESEFVDLLANSCTKEAHTFVRALVDEKSSPESIYHKLIIMYDTTVPPETAKQLLLDYRVKRNENLAIAQAYILDKASIIAKLCISEKEKKLISDFEAIQALPRALPMRSRSEVNKQYRLLMQELGRAPTYIELVASLESLRLSIDEDIKYNGFNATRENSRYMNYVAPRYKISTFATQLHNTNSPRLQRFNQTSFNPRDNNRTHNSNSRSTNFNAKNQRSSYTVNNLNSQRSFNNNFMNKNLSCLLCGRQGHTAAMQCYQLRDAQGKNVSNVSPSQDPCPTCLKQSGKRLFHPEKYCFIKNKPNMKRSNFQKQ